MAYQLISLDPLIDEDQCKRDAKQMKDLGANAIRVYHVDPTGDHKGCMAAFEDAGIYLFVDLDTFTTQISQVGIWTRSIGSGIFTYCSPNRQDNPSWNDTSLSAFSKVLDEFIKYDNTAAVFVGNEVLTFGMSTGSADDLFLMYWRKPIGRCAICEGRYKRRQGLQGVEGIP